MPHNTDTLLAQRSETVETIEALMRYPSHAVSMAIEKGLLVPGSLVLDLGCGDGRNTKLLLEKGFRVVAVDREANSSIADIGDTKRFRFLETDIAELAWVNNGPYDAVIANFSLRNLPEGEFMKVSQKMRNYSVPGGFHLIEDYTNEGELRPPVGEYWPAATEDGALSTVGGLYLAAGWDVIYDHSEFRQTLTPTADGSPAVQRVFTTFASNVSPSF
jgi:tellurite methyltransferase